MSLLLFSFLFHYCCAYKYSFSNNIITVIESDEVSNFNVIENVDVNVEVIFSKGITKIEGDELKHLKITNVTFPSTLLDINPLCLNSNYLETIILNEQNKNFVKKGNGLIKVDEWKLILYENANKDQPIELYLDDNIISIGKNVFNDNQYIEKIYFNPYVEKIEDNCFSRINYLKEIYLNKRVGYFGKGCFNECSNLKKIYYFGVKEPKCSQDAFENSVLFDIIVPTNYQSLLLCGSKVNIGVMSYYQKCGNNILCIVEMYNGEYKLSLVGKGKMFSFEEKYINENYRKQIKTLYIDEKLNIYQIIFLMKWFLYNILTFT